MLFFFSLVKLRRSETDNKGENDLYISLKLVGNIMALYPKSGAVGRYITAKKSQEEVEEFFEPQLIRLKLGREHIEKQNLEDLEQSLSRVNEAIAHPESFGILKFVSFLPVLTFGWVLLQVRRILR